MNWLAIQDFNEHGDFASIKEGSLSFKLHEKVPLVEYTPQGEPSYIHCGFHLVTKFVQQLGNKKDFAAYIMGKLSEIEQYHNSISTFKVLLLL